MISGRWSAGVVVNGERNIVQRNIIGTDVNGTVALGNNRGVNIVGRVRNRNVPTFDNFIVENVISASGPASFILGSSGFGVGLGGTKNVIIGNKIGLDTTGRLIFDANGNSLGNAHKGVFGGGVNNVVGGTTPEKRNIISGNGAGGIVLGGTGHLIRGNYVGTDITGTVAFGNGGIGNSVGIDAPGSGIRIGGTDHDLGVCNRACNLVAGSTRYGVQISGNDNRLEGNFIGTDITGTTNTDALGNTFGNNAGVIVSGFDNVVGGTATGAGNLISGNRGPDEKGFAVGGVRLRGIGFGRHLVQGNPIGTQADGTSPLGNSLAGVFIDGQQNTIGGTAPGAGNVIAYNTSDGVAVPDSRFSACGNDFSGHGNSILGNSIHSNGSLTVSDNNLGIDLGSSAASTGAFGIEVTLNDVRDPDCGGNNKQNVPDLTSATSVSGSTAVVGTLNSTPNTGFRIEFFANSVLDPSGHGEGEKFLGSTKVRTDANGDVSFTAILPVKVPASQRFITATATSQISDTSEFSGGVEVPVADLSLTKSDAPDPVTVGQDVTYTLTITNNGPADSTGATVIDNLPAGVVFVLARIHRWTGMDGVRTAEGGEGVTGAMIRARIWVDGRLAGGLQALLGAPMAAYSGCGERDGGIGHGKRRSRTGLARVCGDVGLAGGSVADGRRQAGSGMARSRARARLNWSSQGQRRGRCRVNRRAERVIRPAKAKTRRLRVLVVTIC